MGLLWYAAHELESPYTIRTEWKIYADDDNSGVFIGFPDPGDDPWDPVSNGYEIQIDPTDGDPTRTTGSVYSFQAPDAAARAAALRPHGEWNVIEVEVDGQDITIRLNGTLINENDGAGRDVTYRSVQVKGGGLPPLDTTKPTGSADVDGPRRADGAYTGPVTVTLAGEDEGGSGVSSVEYALDGGDWTEYEVPLTVSARGEHTLQYRVTDVAGNVSDAGAIAFTIVAAPDADPDPPGSGPPSSKQPDRPGGQRAGRPPRELPPGPGRQADAARPLHGPRAGAAAHSERGRARNGTGNRLAQGRPQAPARPARAGRGRLPVP
jgi:hypothetical protein